MNTVTNEFRRFSALLAIRAEPILRHAGGMDALNQLLSRPSGTTLAVLLACALYRTLNATH